MECSPLMQGSWKQPKIPLPAVSEQTIPPAKLTHCSQSHLRTLHSAPRDKACQEHKQHPEDRAQIMASQPLWPDARQPVSQARTRHTLGACCIVGTQQAPGTAASHNTCPQAGSHPPHRSMQRPTDKQIGRATHVSWAPTGACSRGKPCRICMEVAVCWQRHCAR